MKDRQSLYHKACEIAAQNGMQHDFEKELFIFRSSNSKCKLKIIPKPDNGVLICVEKGGDIAPVFLDKSAEPLIEPIIDMIAFLMREG